MSLKDKLNSVGDNELKNIIYAVCLASGIEKEKADGLVSDIPKLRQSLMKTEDGQLEALMASVRRQDVDEMIKKLN